MAQNVIDPVQQALDDCTTKVLEGALPSSFDPAALNALREAVSQQFGFHINGHPGVWQQDRPEVLRMAWHLGAIARLIASIKGEAPIREDTAKEAGALVSRNCTLSGGRVVQPMGKYCEGAF